MHCQQNIKIHKICPRRFLSSSTFPPTTVAIFDEVSPSDQASNYNELILNEHCLVSRLGCKTSQYQYIGTYLRNIQASDVTLTPNPLRMCDHRDHIFVTGHRATSTVNRLSFSVKEYVIISKLFKSTQVTKQMLRYPFSFSVSLLNDSNSDQDVKTRQTFETYVAINPVKPLLTKRLRLPKRS